MKKLIVVLAFASLALSGCGLHGKASLLNMHTSADLGAGTAETTVVDRYVERSPLSAVPAFRRTIEK